MRKISLVAIDLDGTLLLSGTKKMAEEGARLLRCAAQRGVRVVIATTRSPDNTRDFCLQLGLHDPMICNGGAEVWGSPEGPVWAKRVIPGEAARTIAEYADNCGWELHTTINSVIYLRLRPGQSLGPLAPNRIIVPSNSAGLVGDPERILVFQPDAIAGLSGLCAVQLEELVRTDIFYDPDGSLESLGIFALHANKGAGLREVLDRLGIPTEQVMAIGDNAIDVPMFDVAGLSVAMGNAPPEVKRCASVVAPSNDQEGVAWALHEYVLEDGC